jgi:hypothetical protein
MTFENVDRTDGDGLGSKDRRASSATLFQL